MLVGRITIQVVEVGAPHTKRPHQSDTLEHSEALGDRPAQRRGVVAHRERKAVLDG